MKSGKTTEENVEVFFRVTSLLHRLVDRHFKCDFGKITLQQVRVVEEVFFCGGGISLKELAERLSISASAASQVVESLVKDGLLLRVPSADDRRAVVISVSPKVRETHALHLKFFKELLDRALKAVPQKDVDVAVGVLNVILSNLEKEMVTK